MTDNNTSPGQPDLVQQQTHFAFAAGEVTAVGGDYAESFSGVTVSIGASDAGNMDAVAWADTPPGLLVAVCDGMGPSGERAARVAIKAVVAHMRDVNADDDVVENLRIAISAAHFAVRTLTERTADGSGATIAVLLIGTDRAVAAWMGDVRVYQLRGRTAVFRSTDHSKVMELVRAGVFTDEQARTSSEAHIVTRSLGHTRDDKARVARLPYLRGDRFVVCSDGVWRAFPQKKLLKLLGRPRDPEIAAVNTIEVVRTESSEADDLTLAVIDTTSNSTIKPRMRTSHKIILTVLAVLLACSIACNVLQYLDIIPGTGTTEPTLQTVAVPDTIVPAPDTMAVDTTAIDTIATVALNTELATTGTVAERITALEAYVAGLNDTADKTARGQIVDKAVAEINALSAECADNATAREYLAKASEFLRLRKYTVDGTTTEVRNQAGAVCGQLRRARAAL